MLSVAPAIASTPRAVPLVWVLGVLFAVVLGFVIVAARRGDRLLALKAAAVLPVLGALTFVFRERALSLQAIRIEPFGSALAAGLGLGTWLSARLARASLLEPTARADAFIGALVGALVGARAVYVLTSAARETWVDTLALGLGGLDGYGALAGAVAGGSLVLARRGLRIAPFLDVGAPGALLAASVSRLGCYWAGCHAGRALDGAAPAVLRVLGEVPGSAAPVHPTQLYEAIGTLTLSALCVRVRRMQRGHGVVVAFAATGYAALRFALEMTRSDVAGIARWSATAWFAIATLVIVPASYAAHPRLRRAITGSRSARY